MRNEFIAFTSKIFKKPGREICVICIKGSAKIEQIFLHEEYEVDVDLK
jgi:hypothetical protein